MIERGYDSTTRAYADELPPEAAAQAGGNTTLIEVNVGAGQPAGNTPSGDESVKVDVGAVIDGAGGGASNVEGSDAVLIDLSGPGGKSPDTVVVDLGDDKGKVSPDSTYVVVETPDNGTPAVVIDASPTTSSGAPEVIVVDMTGNAGAPGATGDQVQATIVDAGGADAATSAALSAALAAQSGTTVGAADEVMASVLEAVDSLPEGSRDEGAPVIIVLTDAKDPPPSVTVAEGHGELTAQQQSIIANARLLHPGEIRITRMLTSSYLEKYVYTVAYPPAVPTPAPPPTVRLLKRLRVKGGQGGGGHVLGASLHAHLSQKHSRQVIRRVASVTFGGSASAGGGGSAPAPSAMGSGESEGAAG